MSWIEDELRRREAEKARESTPAALPTGDRHSEAQTSGILALWDRFEAANSALPDALRLRRQVRRPDAGIAVAPIFLVWLIAPNGAGLGLTPDAIRYQWPKENARKSHNFWIHWRPKKGYRLVRRIGPAMGVPKTAERRFRESAVDDILRCLVTNTRVDYRHVSRGLLAWLLRLGRA